MRLFLSETFFDAVIELPKRIQDKVVAFQKSSARIRMPWGFIWNRFQNSTILRCAQHV